MILKSWRWLLKAKHSTLNFIINSLKRCYKMCPFFFFLIFTLEITTSKYYFALQYPSKLIQYNTIQYNTIKFGFFFFFFLHSIYLSIYLSIFLSFFLSFFLFIYLSSPHRVRAEVLNCSLEINKFELQSCYYVHFRNVEKGINLLISTPAMD